MPATLGPWHSCSSEWRLLLIRSARRVGLRLGKATLLKGAGYLVSD